MRTIVLVMAILGLLACSRHGANTSVAGETTAAKPPTATANKDSIFYVRGLFSQRDLQQIADLVLGKTNETILRIMQDEKSREVEVTCGIVKGPLNGHGSRFVLAKQGDEWRIIFQGKWLS